MWHHNVLLKTLFTPLFNAITQTEGETVTIFHIWSKTLNRCLISAAHLETVLIVEIFFAARCVWSVHVLEFVALYLPQADRSGWYWASDDRRSTECEALYPSVLLSVKVASKRKQHVSHWKIFTGGVHVNIVITSICQELRWIALKKKLNKALTTSYMCLYFHQDLPTSPWKI